MNNPFRTPEDYELFLYGLAQEFTSIKHSTLTFVRLGATLARVSGELHFEKNYRVVARERILYNRLPVIVDWYGYEIWKGIEKLSWYDSQPHPNEQSLQSTYPHHKHIPPNMKHNRLPAPGMSFIRPNLPIIIQEVESLISKEIS